MPLPDNTLPMMTGRGPYGSVEMGGMFSVLKVRDRLPATPPEQLALVGLDAFGWASHPAGTQAQAVELPADLPAPRDPRAPQPDAAAATQPLQVRKPMHQHDH